jgi:integrase
VLPGTLAEALIAYKRSPEWAGLKPNTRQAYFRYLQYLEEAWNNPIAGITRRTLLAMRDAVAGECGPAAANGFITAASAAFKWARDRGYIENSPLVQVARLPGGEFPAWSPEQIDHALKTFSEPLRRAIILGLYSGQRRSDLISMSWSQYDGQSLTLRQIKTGKPLVIPCHSVLRAELEQWKQDRTSTLILTTHRGLPWSGTHLSTAFARAVRAARLPSRLNIHGIRKAACAALAEAGCSILEIQAVSGHASMSSLAIYVRSAEQHRLAGAAVHRLEQRK